MIHTTSLNTFHGKIGAVVWSLVKALISADSKLVHGEIDELINQNNLILNAQHRGFCYNGLYYKSSIGDSPVAILQDMGYDPVLSKQLVSRVDKLADRWRQIETDRELLTRLFRDLTAPCRSIQDLRDALPECVIQFDPALQGMPRTREEAYTVRCDAALRLRYGMALERIHTYAAMHLLSP